MASYHLSNLASEDLANILEYGITTFGFTVAEQYYDGLICRFQEIANHPNQYPSIDHIRVGYRRSVFKSHTIYYKTIDTDVHIIRILNRQSLNHLT